MVDCVFSTFRPSLFSSALVSFCSSHEKGCRLESTLRAPSWCIRQPGQFDRTVRGEEEGEQGKGGWLFILYFPPPVVNLPFHRPSFLFVLRMKRGVGGHQLSELPPGVFDNLGSLQYLYVGKKKENKEREDGCSFCIFHHLSSIFLFIPLRFFLFFS